MMRRFFAFAALLAGALATAPVFAHPYSTSITQMDWNAASARYEVALRLLPEQLEKALKGRLGDKPPVEAIDPAIVDWLRETITLATPEREAAELRWVGKEVEVDAAWLYFELLPPAGRGPEGLELRNSVLFATQPHQLNTVRVRIGQRQHAWVLRHDRPAFVIRLPPPE